MLRDPSRIPRPCVGHRVQHGSPGQEPPRRRLLVGLFRRALEQDELLGDVDADADVAAVAPE